MKLLRSWLHDLGFSLMQRSRDWPTISNQPDRERSMSEMIDYVSEAKGSQLYADFLNHLPTKQLHNYVPLFVRHFEPCRMTVQRVLEIGVEAGTSLRMWRDYFPNAEIWGFDIDPRCKSQESDRIKVVIGDQTKEMDLNTLPGNFDIVIDDGLHTQDAQIKTFLFIFREKMAERGIYVVEDCEKRFRTIDFFKNLGNLINWWPEDVLPRDWPKLNDLTQHLAASNLSRQDQFLIRYTLGVSIYRHIIFVDRGRNPEDGTASFRLNEPNLVADVGRVRQQFLDT